MKEHEEKPDPFKPVADLLFAYLHDIIYEPTTASLKLDDLPASFHDFGKGLQYLNYMVCEARSFAKELAAGNLDCQTPTASNEVVSPLKSLHASLRHLTWQTQQVAKGDYNQRVKFMGDFSSAFNNMIQQLEHKRQIILKENEKLTDKLIITEHLSMIDALTNIPNRRCIDERLPIEWNRAMRTNTPISLLMIDIDNFKNLNDTCGHQYGDTVLKIIAAIFHASLKRSGDFCARWGGEEFVILLPNTLLAGAMEVAERIRLTVENTVVPCATASSPMKITISIGVNSIAPTKDCLIGSFIFNADKALYTAKQTGKNKVVYALA